jgi:aryl-alcohol dehydrogenase-like predicted oxidoreductase
VILGCGNFGGIGSAPAFFGMGTSREDALELLDAAWELGITTLDTADAYGGGRSETVVGEWLRRRSADVRERVVVTTKTFNPMVEGGDRGLSRARIRRQLRDSLGRLGLERVPLYMAHDFDPDTPQEETIEAFDELIREGLVGAVGASNFSAEQLAEALEIAKLERFARYEWAQECFSLADQRARQTVFPLVHEHGIGLTPFSPLAGGLLTGKYRRGAAVPPGSRLELRGDALRELMSDRMFDALDELAERAAGHGVSMAGLALAWLLHVPEVTAIVVGPGRAEHLEPVREALGVTLSDDERDALERTFR